MSKTDPVSLKDFVAAASGVTPPAAESAPTPTDADPTPADPNPTPASAKGEFPTVAYVKVKAPTTELHHVLTGVVFNDGEKKVDIDDFVKAQIEAGKLQLVPV